MSAGKPLLDPEDFTHGSWNIVSANFPFEKQTPEVTTPEAVPQATPEALFEVTLQAAPESIA